MEKWVGNAWIFAKRDPVITGKWQVSLATYRHTVSRKSLKKRNPVVQTPTLSDCLWGSMQQAWHKSKGFLYGVECGQSSPLKEFLAWQFHSLPQQ